MSKDVWVIDSFSYPHVLYKNGDRYFSYNDEGQSQLIDCLLSELNNLEYDFKNLEEEVDSLESEISDLESKISDLERTNSDLEDTVEELENKFANLEDEHAEEIRDLIDSYEELLKTINSRM